MQARFGSVVSFALAAMFAAGACHETSRTPLALPTSSPLSDAPTASPAPPMPPPEPKAKKPAAQKLDLEVVTASKEGFLVNSTLVTGKKDAVLIDAQFTLPDARRVAAAVAASGKNLTTVFVTHSHPDHYFGFPAIKERFPSARLVALPQTVAAIEKTWEEKLKQWGPLYDKALTTKPLVPEAIAGGSIDLEGQKLELVGGKQGDSPDNAYVWIPSLRAVVTGDIVYDGVFPWTAETTPIERKAWSATLDEIAERQPALVIPGHQKPERTYQPSNLTFTRGYLAAWDEALASATSAANLEARIKARYPDTALEQIVRIAADAAFPRKPAKKRPATQPKKP